MIRSRIEPMRIPSAEELGEIRAARFRERISALVNEQDPEDGLLRQLVTEVVEAHDGDAMRVATALARATRGARPLIPPNDPPQRARRAPPRRDGDRRERGDRRRGLTIAVTVVTVVVTSTIAAIAETAAASLTTVAIAETVDAIVMMLATSAPSQA